MFRIEWARGWQFHASRVREKRFIEFGLKPQMRRDQLAMLMSQGGRFAAKFLQTIPKSWQTSFPDEHMQNLLRRRLRLDLTLGLSKCVGKRCRQRLNSKGDHLASCMKSGRVKLRANPLEAMWAQVCEEAGGRVVPNSRLSALRLGVDPSDTRRVEFCVHGLRFGHGGVPLLCDCTQVSVLSQKGEPHPRTTTVPGIAIERAEKRKPETYKEVAQKRGIVQLVTLACETQGRWSETCVLFIQSMAKQKAKEAPPVMRRSAELGWTSRWWSLLSCAAQRSFIASITDVDTHFLQKSLAPQPTLEEGCDAARPEVSPDISRLPLRA